MSLNLNTLLMTGDRLLACFCIAPQPLGHAVDSGAGQAQHECDAKAESELADRLSDSASIS